MGKQTEYYFNRIKKLRTDKHLSQTELAHLLHCSQGTISAYEQFHSLPTTRHLITLSHQFNISIDYLIGLSNCPIINDQLPVMNELYLSLQTLSESAFENVMVFIQGLKGD